MESSLTQSDVRAQSSLLASPGVRAHRGSARAPPGVPSRRLPCHVVPGCRVTCAPSDDVRSVVRVSQYTVAPRVGNRRRSGRCSMDDGHNDNVTLTLPTLHVPVRCTSRFKPDPSITRAAANAPPRHQDTDQALIRAARRHTRQPRARLCPLPPRHRDRHRRRNRRRVYHAIMFGRR